MKGLDVAELVGLAALWGASFLLLRMGAGDFGPVALSAVRVSGAALLLVPLLACAASSPHCAVTGGRSWSSG